MSIGLGVGLNGQGLGVVGVAPAPAPPPVPLVAALVGQSQNERLITNASVAVGSIPKPTLVAENVLTTYLDPHGTGADINAPDISVVQVNQTNVDAGLVNPAMAALSDFLAYRLPGQTFVMVDMSVPGTGFADLMDDGSSDRVWADTQAMIDRIGSDGMQIGHLVWNWMGNDAVEARTYHESFAPLFFGQAFDGAPLTLGSTNPDSQRAQTVDHVIYDADAPEDQRGRGAFTRAETKLHMVGWPSFNPRVPGDPEMLNFSETGNGAFAGYSVQVDAPARQKVRDLLADPRLGAAQGWHGPSCHVVRMTQNDGQGGSTLATHPDYREADGLILMAWPFALTMARAFGDTGIRTFRLTGATVAADGSAARIGVVDTDGNALTGSDVLTTLRRQRGTADPSVLPPHFQSVVGFEIRRAGDTDAARRPVFRPDAGPAYPDSHKGTVTIDGNEIVITPVVPFANGDIIEFLRGDASAVLLEGRDADARLYLDMPVVHVPALYQSAATYPLEAVPVDPQPASIVVSGITAAPAVDSFATKGAASNAYVTGPVIAANVSALTVELDAVVGAGSGAVELAHYISTTFRIRLDARATKRRLLLTVENADGSKAFGDVPTQDGVVPVDTRAKLLISVTLDRGDGTAEMGVYVDGQRHGALFTATSAANATFTTGRVLEALNDTGVDMDLYALRIWNGYTSDGDVSGLGAPVHGVTGDAASWNAPGTGLAKAGNDPFT